MIPFFYLFHISGAGKHLRAKELKLKMSGGGKSCSQECLWVENSWCSKSHFGKYLAMENTLRWKMFGHPKSCNHCQKVKKNITYIDPNLFNCSCGVGVGVSDSFCINLIYIILSEQMI